MVERFRVVPAAYLILRRSEPRDEVLVQLRQNTGYMDGYWACGAAGHVEAGESVLAAGTREAAEELGIAVDPADLEPVTAMHRTHGNGRAIDERVDFFLQCRRWSGRPRIQETAKCAELRWVEPAALPDPVVPHEKVVLDALAAGQVPPILSFGFGG